MGFRQPLELDDFIEDYEPWLHGRNGSSKPNGSFGGASEHNIVLGHTVDPLIVGSDPEFCSTSVDIVRRPEIIWDVNEYYRLLGLNNYRAKKIELKNAFLEKDGHSSALITNAFKQLLDPEIRQEYDAMPLGERYMNDPYMQDEVKQKAQKVANKRQQDGEEVSTEDVLNEMGFGVDKEEEENAEPASQVEEHEPEDWDDYPYDWFFSYFLWKSISMDLAPLAKWQEAIRKGLVLAGVKTYFGVGWLGGSSAPYWTIKKVNNVWVVFLSEHLFSGILDEAMVSTAVQQLIQINKNK